MIKFVTFHTATDLAPRLGAAVEASIVTLSGEDGA
jgi:hypothetical protein